MVKSPTRNCKFTLKLIRNLFSRHFTWRGIAVANMIIYRCEMAPLPVLRSLVGTVESATHRNWPPPVPTCISDSIATKVKTRLDLTSHTQFMILYVSGFLLFVCFETFMVTVLTISLEDVMVVLFLNVTKITYNVYDSQDETRTDINFLNFLSDLFTQWLHV